MKFMREFWDMLGKDVMMAMNEFHHKAALCISLNSTFIALIPLKKGASKLRFLAILSVGLRLQSVS